MNIFRPIILIPARMASTRLPGKPLADIAGLPMIVQVARRAGEAARGLLWPDRNTPCPVYVATDSQEIFEAVRQHDGNAVMTGGHHQSGTDRIAEALENIERQTGGEYDAIINVQGDLPTIDPAIIHMALIPLSHGDCDIGTLAAEITAKDEIENPNVVKPVFALDGMGAGIPYAHKAQTFTRLPKPASDGKFYHHIGLYAYTRSALKRFVSLPPSPSEQREKLEQLRALDNGLKIGICVVDTVPLGVDTPEDLEKARKALKEHA